MSIQNNELMTTTGNRFILPQAVETTFTAEELAEDMDGIQLNFRQVKVPAGGTLQYEIPTEDPDVPDYDRFLEGIILFHHPSNAYWPDVEDGGDGENVPPQCQALDGKFGHGSPGGLCASCGYNRFGTRGKGKACKNMHMVYLLRSGEFMPLQITLPPTSIKPFNEFVSRAFLLHRRGICSALVQLGLKKMNNGKDDYSVTTFKLLRYFEGEELCQIRNYADQFKEQVKEMLSQRAEQADAISGDVVEVGTPSRRLPDNEDHFAIGGVIDGEREELPA
ncbi:hypothetical protein [Oscillibacter sp.]|uniref:hypothetical protein n=1 Tax=Oscillibacter sp. TaxID=1945593 RepID=UPI002D7E1A29|nr:hypothetical protein [Oscillibacter sp.]MBS6355365.1 hypothetical protein [Oscillibacter sp.]